MKIKDDEMIIKRREYIDLLMENAKLREQASPFHEYSINELREMFGLPKIELEKDKKIEKLDNTELYLTESQQRIIVNKINEIIEVLNKCG